MKSHNLDIDLCGIPENLVSQHQNRVRRWLRESRCHFFRIIDTCRRDNYGILDPQVFTKIQSSPTHKTGGISAFIPAAGASSRYFQPLEALSLALLAQDWAAAKIAATHIVSQPLFKNWVLPKQIKDLIEKISLDQAPSGAEFEAYQYQLCLPKALQVASDCERSFLTEKLREHEQIPEIDHQVFVAPPRFEEKFRDELNHQAQSKPWEVLVQSADLSTVRFDAEGEPIRLPDGKASTVPAGHGALARLFAKASKATGNKALFIRNIDNFTGTNPEIISATSSFLKCSQNLHSWISTIREYCLKADWSAAEKFARQLREQLNIDYDQIGEENKGLGSQFVSMNLDGLFLIQVGLFHTPVQYVQDMVHKTSHRDALAALYGRPVNILGQVRNTERDVGGTPCFVEVDRRRVKICLEVPHASQDDKKHFLTNPERATHFNPVFAYSEVPEQIDYYDSHANDFWIIAEKKFESRVVYYHETVLYELIGNSLASNCVFVEIPRKLFNPHKSISDCIPKT